MILKTYFVLALTMSLIFAAASLAQDDKKQKKLDASTRSVQGTVFDAAGAFVVGSVVELKDVRTLQVRSFISKENGEYHFYGLKLDNDYEVKADHQGATSGWKKISLFDNRKIVTQNLKLEKK